MTAIMNAVKANDLATVRELIEQGADVNALDAGGDAPLILAAYKGYTDIVRALLEAGASTSVVDPGMRATALHAAAYAGHAPAAGLLVEFGIEIDKQGPNNGYTALHDAVWQGNFDVAQVLVDGGANLELKSHQGETALDFAKSRGENRIASLIATAIAER